MLQIGKTGKIVIISSPSGGGKTTICNRLRELNPEYRFSISYTTRSRRADEVNGREYVFVSDEEFEKLEREGFFAETARVHLYRYGTPHGPLQEALHTGQVIMLDVDVQGAESIRKAYPREALTMFILPPSADELKSRLTRRGTETENQLQVRLNNAIAEMNEKDRFDYIIVNKDINVAVSAADHMIKSWTVGVTSFGRNK